MYVINDIEGSHFNNVKASFLASAPNGTTVTRVYLTDSELLDYCIENDVQVAIIPYSGRQYRYAELMHNGTHVFVAGKGFPNSENSSQDFGSPISVGGGGTQTENYGDGAEIYTEALNLSLPQRYYTSYTCAYLAGLAVSSGLLDSYTPFEFKQLVRQNGDNYPNHSTTQGFGKVTSISDGNIEESLDVMNIQAYYTQGRNNLIFKRVKLPEYYTGDIKFYVDGSLKTPDATLTDNFRKETWLFWKSNGNVTGSTEFGATYHDLEDYNQRTIGANVSAYVISEQFPVFNETFVWDNNGVNYVEHRSIIDDVRYYQDCMKVRVYDGDEIIYEEVSRSTSSFNLSNASAGNHITFECYANGLLYPETDKYLWDGTDITFLGESYYDPNDAPVPEPQPDPDPDPTAPTPPVLTFYREDETVYVEIVEPLDSTVIVYKFIESEDWTVIDEFEGSSGSFTVDATKNYIFNGKVNEGDLQSDYTNNAYILGEEVGSIGVIF